MAPAELVTLPRIADSTINLECRLLHEVVLLLRIEDGHGNELIIGEVVGIHIAQKLVPNGRVDVTRLRLFTSLIYDEYAVVGEVITPTSWKKHGSAKWWFPADFM
jgi:flavin reductase (DIM6/NTAB) family NADH-FMN oxidoreductase RutF